ncbi:MAG: hypothetical protein IJC93_09615 [Clostridia bacterium]|nr:hypothetical protein [Clostridia bacterium]
MDILLTAFKGEHNSSYQLIKDVECDKLFLTNSFEGLEEDIEECDCEQYSAVIMFGQDTKLKDRIRIDVRAQTEFGTKDTVWDVSAISEMFDICGVPNYISKRPTKYLCNYAYYLMLKKMCGRAVFIHIPPERYITDEIRQNIVSVVQKLSR